LLLTSILATEFIQGHMKEVYDRSVMPFDVRGRTRVTINGVQWVQ